MYINIYIIYEFISFSVVKRNTSKRGWGVKEEKTHGVIFYLIIFSGDNYSSQYIAENLSKIIIQLKVVMKQSMGVKVVKIVLRGIGNIVYFKF